MNNCNISKIHTVVTPELFWHAINILITKPHVVNKRLWGSIPLRRYMCKVSNKTWEPLLPPISLKYRGNIDIFITTLMSCKKTQLVSDEDSNVELILTELLPRNYNENHAFQLIVLSNIENTATFYDVSPDNSQNLCPNFSYRFLLQNNIITLFAEVDETTNSYKWLMTNVLPQLNKWSLEVTSNIQRSTYKSLALVQHDQYYIKYNTLKEKYGKELVKIWPECTDPSKFVYEDIAIATYLLLLWEKNHDECEAVASQTFVDMGCGNGLLVYILTMEGHNGYGIDVRKRKIWDMYPRNIRLFEKTITPSNIDTFTDMNWIIGNHSDELTPWIPVIAARSSYKCKFFLLPCCAYNFDGTKYQRQNSSKSQYTEYLDYIKNLCDQCGFETFTDRLKIPSTKRVCFIGQKRKHEEEDFNKYCESIDTLIKSSITSSLLEGTEADNFKAREATEKVRNCTQIDKNVIDSIITCVSKYLLEGCNIDTNWSPGKSIDISEVVALLPPDNLKVLKSECGGLQTLFKNNHHIFNVKNGKVQLQYPKTIEEMYKSTAGKKSKSNIKLKVKKCWFYSNHPQGCPLKDDECSFVHWKL